jgi:hypothetical protein
MSDLVQLGLKGFEPAIANRSVVQDPTYTQGLGVHPLIMTIASYADSIPVWSTQPGERDKYLRAFWPTEPTLAGAVFATVSRNASFQWEITQTDFSKPKPKNTIRAVERMLMQRSNRGRGWINYRQKIMEDLCTQDNGAFHELVREKDSPNSPVLAINHLDSAKCFRTGDPEAPVIYTDMLGRQHVLKWWNVIPESLFPSAIEESYDVQYSPVTIALLAAQILRDIAIYKKEKVSGGNSRAIHFVTGVSQDTIDDSKAWSREQNMNMGLIRYSDPIVVPTLDPSHPVHVETIQLASLPDSFDEDSTFKWYIVQLANAFGVDYQELAPLPGGNLGSSQQSSMLHQKTQGKGPALSIAMTEWMLNNNGILPDTVKFSYREHDLSAEKDKAEARFTRDKSRSLLINSGVIDPQGALELAVRDGDIPEYVANDIVARGLADQWYQNRLNKPVSSATQIASGMESQTTR